MFTINEIMHELRLLYGDQYDVRLVPSVQIGGGHICRATISNIPRMTERSATHRSSYRIALNTAYKKVLNANDL